MKSPAHLCRGVGAGGFIQGELFEPPQFSPTYPKSSTLNGKALALLLEGRAITHPDFQNITKSWRLSERVRALRHDYGWPVQTIEIPAPTAECPTRKIARYALPGWVIQQVEAHHDQ